LRFNRKILLIFLIAFVGFGWVRYDIPIGNRDAIELTLDIASDEMGKKELTGKNDGEHITKYMNATGLSGSRGYPYCAAGLVWCLKTATDSLNIKYPFAKRSAVANYHFDYAKKNGIKVVSKPVRGGFLVWKSDNSYSGHVEIIKEVVTSVEVVTLGFNTSNGKTGSQREGNGNFERTRYLKSFLGRLRLRGVVGFSEYCKL